MEIILNANLKSLHKPVTPDAYAYARDQLVNGFIGDLAPGVKYHYKTPPYILKNTTLNDANPETFSKGFLGHLSHAYSTHRAIEIAPHDLWFIVLTELANAIKAKPDLCRPLFTKTDEKQTIMIPVNDPTSIDLNYVIEQLRGLCPAAVELFVPELSTLDTMARTAMYAAFADGVQHYYSYMTYMCGIPKISITGEKSDWIKLTMTCSTLSELFVEIGYAKVALYLEKVATLFNRAASVFDGVDKDFWLDIYTHKNVGSGAQLDITGWITKFYMGDRQKRLENFLTSVAIVPYKNLETGREYKGVYGGFKRLVTEDQFIKTGYAQLIYEKV